MLQNFEDKGGAIWAEGPAGNDFIVNFSMSIIPGKFTLNDNPQRVASVLGQLGVPTENGGQRNLGGGSVRYELKQIGNGRASATYVIPEGGYAINFSLTAQGGLGYYDLAAQIAYTIQGC